MDDLVRTVLVLPSGATQRVSLAPLGSDDAVYNVSVVDSAPTTVDHRMVLLDSPQPEAGCYGDRLLATTDPIRPLLVRSAQRTATHIVDCRGGNQGVPKEERLTDL